MVLGEGALPGQVLPHVAGLQRPPQGDQFLRRSRGVRRLPDDVPDGLQDGAPVVDEDAVQVEEDHICHPVIIPCRPSGEKILRGCHIPPSACVSAVTEHMDGRKRADR